MTTPASVVPDDLVSPAERPWFDRLGNGLVVVLPARKPDPNGWGRGGPPHGGAWIHLGADGKVRAFTGKVEVGQGTRTALLLLIAEELALPISAIELTMGDTDVSPWDMGTFGSRSMADAGEHLRLTAAAMRAILCELGAARLGIVPESVELVDGQVHVRGHPAGGSLGMPSWSGEFIGLRWSRRPPDPLPRPSGPGPVGRRAGSKAARS